MAPEQTPVADPVDDDHVHDYSQDIGGFCVCGYEESPDERDERLQDIEDDRAFEAWRERNWR